MKLSELKSHLNTIEAINFRMEDGTTVPEHFHVTEIGVVTKNFIDCGGTIRNEKTASLQLWDANDFDHRLKAHKLSGIIALSEKALGMEDLEIEVEYQSGTIGKYALHFDGKDFILLSTATACLASDACGIPSQKQSAGVNKGVSACVPGGGCC